MEPGVRTRFAPSPTGFMHVGSVRTALFSWLLARKQGGAFILRIEDTDKEREVEGSIPHIIESLKWLGLTWDEGPEIGGAHGPYIQSERLETYRAYAQKLIDAGYAYPDPYTQEELDAFRAEAQAAKRPFLYRNHRPNETGEWDGTKPLRFRTPEVKRYEWQDAVRGPLSAGEEALDDVILIKSDGYPTYNFAHIVDDIEMGVTHVLRGEEFVSSTPKFLALYEALGVTPPTYGTLPVILGPDGKKKLSKRDGAKDLLEYRADGYLPEAIVNYLALLGWNPGTPQEFFQVEELIKAFSLERVQKSGAVFNETKLLSLNQQWMRSLDDDAYVARGGLIASDTDKLRKAVPLLKERAHTFREAQEMIDGELACLFGAVAPTHDELVAKEPEDAPGSTRTHLAALESRIASLPENADVSVIQEALMPYADQEGRGAVLWPLRYALSGAKRSPDPFTLIWILGKGEALARIHVALSIAGK